jgi:HKD family nuclease
VQASFANASPEVLAATAVETIDEATKAATSQIASWIAGRAMQFLATQCAIHETISRLIRECSRLRWAVAWASAGFHAFDLLSEHVSKIEQLSVGTHFFQTHPKFIEAFRNNPKVRFVLGTTPAVFHPKLYLFEHDDGWKCVIGSPNFTRQGSSSNDEVAVLFSCHDLEAAEAKRSIDSTLDSFFALGMPFSEVDFEEYRKEWDERRIRLKRLRRRLNKHMPQRRPRTKSIVADLEETARLDHWKCKDWLFLFFCTHPIPTEEELLERAAVLRSHYPHITDPTANSVGSWRQAWIGGYGIPVKAGTEMGFTRPFDDRDDLVARERHKGRIDELRRQS